MSRRAHLGTAAGLAGRLVALRIACHSFTRGRIGTLALCLSLLMVSVGSSQDADSLAQSELEREALELLNNGLAITARTRAEEALRQNPDSIVGHYVLGRMMFEAEGALGRAMYHLGRARELYETNYMRTGLGSPFHQELLYTLSRLAGQMELHDYQLELLGYHDHLYDPDLIAEHCWPLLKLGRIEEARQYANIAAHSQNPWQRSAGLNALCALESEARSREPAHRACLAALEDARAEAARHHRDDEEQSGIAVDAYNAAQAAAQALRLSQAREYALEGVRRFEPTGADPWQILVELYLSAGQMSEAIDAFSSMLAWNNREPASMRDQGSAEHQAIVSLMLLLAGETERAMDRIERAMERPDRRGLTTDGAEQARGRHALIRHMIQNARNEELAEEASWRGYGSQLYNVLGALPRRIAMWPDEERITGVMADRDRLTSSLRPYMSGGIIGLSPWLAPELVSVLGPAVVQAGVDRARFLDETAELESLREVDAYYRAIEVEIAAAYGDDARVVDLAPPLLEALSEPPWAMVRARVAARAAEAAWSRGDNRAAQEWYSTALEIDPGVLRRTSQILPVRIVAGGDAAASEAAGLLARSPRFSSFTGLFELSVDSFGDGLRGCLRTASGNELRCVEAYPPPPEPPPSEAPEGQDPDAESGLDEDEDLSLAQRLAREVHQRLFAANIPMSRIDFSSLDGSTIGGSREARDRLRELLPR